MVEGTQKKVLIKIYPEVRQDLMKIKYDENFSTVNEVLKNLIREHKKNRK